jgi:putative membrane protein
VDSSQTKHRQHGAVVTFTGLAPRSDDPRVFFAAERTLLAWQRTAIAVIGLGFVIERFGLFMRFANGAALPPGHALMSLIVALLFLLSGACVALISVWQYRRFLRELSAPELPRGYMTWPGPALNLLLASTALAAALWMVVCE